MTPEEKEESFRKRTVAKRKGKYIRVRAWTDENGSGQEGHARSVTGAIKLLRNAAKYHPNFAVECYAESPPDNDESCCDFFHRRKLAYNKEITEQKPERNEQ